MKRQDGLQIGPGGRGRAIVPGQRIRDDPVDRQARSRPVVRGDGLAEERAARRDVARRQRDAGRRNRPDRGLEPLHLALGEPSILGRLQVGPQAADAEGRAFREPGGDACHHFDREPAAAQAGLDLELHPEGRRVIRGREEPVEKDRVAGRDVDRVLPRDVEPCRRNGVQHQDREPDAGLAQLERLVDRGHAQSVGAGRLEGHGDRHRAVSVGVGLDHRADRHAGPGEGSERREVRRQRVEVELEPRGPRKRRQARRRQARLDGGLDRLPGHAGSGSVASSTRTVKPTRLPPLRRSAIPASLRRDVATASGRSDASRPASPNRSRTCSPASPWR